MSPSGGPEDAEESRARLERLERLERVVAELSGEVAALRLELRERAGPRDGRPAALHAPPAGARAGDAFAHLATAGRAAIERRESRTGTGEGDPTVAGRGARRWWGEELDVESLVGRYGTMVLGALTILLGVGAFLSWAVQRITLGPAMRVGLGAAATAAVAALGFWLRRRDREGTGTRRFGNVLLALSLALLHVVAWGAGPVLGVVPPTAALLAAAAASVALAALAWRAGEQALFVVGVGGALVAPFVTAREAGSPLVLLGYGLLVVVLALVAQRAHDWPWARRVLGMGVLGYVGAALDASRLSWPGGGGGWVRDASCVLFVLLCAVAALLAGGRHARSPLARQWLVVLALPLLSAASFGASDPGEPYLILLALAGTALVYAALRLRDARQPLHVASAIGQPPLLLAAALPALPSGAHLASGLVAAAWAALAALAALDAGAGPRLSGARPTTTADAAESETSIAPWSAHLLVAGLLLVAAVVLATRDLPLVGAPILAVVGAGAALVVRRTGEPLLMITPLAALLTATAMVLDRLDGRVPYEYVPFAGRTSFAAAAVVAGWWVAGRLVARSVVGRGIGPTERRLLAALGPAAAFAWGYVELSAAFSPDLADFLLILYLAAAGVLAIALGRRWQVPGGRRVGLALAVWAAVKALAEASDFDLVGLRVGAYLLVGVFLLGVAYWYRAAGERGAASPGGAPPEAA